METQQVNVVDSSLREANDAQVDAVWAILKYREIGIYRKLASISEVLNLDFKEVVSQFPSDEEGRVLDHKTRHMIHDSLISLNGE
tara:strand:- start:60 stop:314 length:255 start_codon:yes stop_codon:yes gene_type:complete